MPGLPSSLLEKLEQTLLECGPFQSDEILISVFSDERIEPWKYEVSSAGSSKNRVRLFVSDFLNRKNSVGQSVLVLFLQALHDQTGKQDERRQRLNDIAIEVAAVLSPNLPPLAGNNLWRASAMHTGEALPANLGGFVISAVDPDSSIQREHLPPDLTASVFVERLESLKNKDKADWLPVSFLEKGLQAARSVGRVEHQGRKIGTAFLVAQDLVLTNAHVVRDISVLKEAGVRFNVGLQVEVQWRYFAKQIVDSPIEELDFALVQLAAAAPGAPVTLSNEAAYRSQYANILQYPQGNSLQVALRRNEIVYVDPKRLYYVTDTEECSSGSPVFNDEWCVIALHRAGIVDDAQRPVKNANQGVPLTAIEPHIRKYLHGGNNEQGFHPPRPAIT